jgi:uncharacterized protein (DUF2147 family)
MRILTSLFVTSCLLLASTSASTQTPTQTPSFPLTGHWLFTEDSTVVEFLPCGDAVCARIRGLPPKPVPGEKPPPCGLEVLIGFKPKGAHWVGEALDHESNKRYRAKVQPGKKSGELELVISALGGLVNESMAMVPAKDFKSCN